MKLAPFALSFLKIIEMILKGSQYFPLFSSRDQCECPHQTMTTCTWWAVDEEDSYRSDMTYFMGVSIEDKIRKKMFPTKTVRVDTSKIGMLILL